MRPYLHEFLAKAYQDNFDIVIWSATSMRWIKLKMDELGVTGNLDYKLTFMVDSKAMISVHAEPYGVIEVKPLGYIWKNFKQAYLLYLKTLLRYSSGARKTQLCLTTFAETL